jgi:hypothetical protein
MMNPWTRLPDRAPFVLSEDRAIVEAHNLHRKPEHQFELEALPEPYLGSVDAPVVLLNLNPGFDPSDLVNYATEARSSMMRRCLTHELHPDEAFYFLTDQFQGTGGWHWWKAKLTPVIEVVGLDRVRRGVLVIEQVPYKSRRFYGLPRALPSQEYTFEMARQAVARKAVIVVMRSYKSWMSHVPELAGGDHHRLSSTQNVMISPRNCPTGFGEIVEALRRVT